MLPECDLRCGEDMDRCSKWGGTRASCRPITIDDFQEGELARCTMEQVCREGSIFGNDFIAITDEDIEALKNGEILYRVDEYGLFMAYKKGENSNA